MIREEDLIVVGKIFKPHGYKGEMNVEIEYGAELFKDSKTPYFIKMDNILVPFFVETIGGGREGTSFLKLRGVDSDLAASGFVRKELYARRSDVAKALKISEDELSMSIAGLDGFRVIDAVSGNFIGTVLEIEEGVEYDYLIVTKGEDDSEIQIPFIDEFISEVKDSGEGSIGEIYVTLPEGFLEI